jgi:hypothetical protein
MATIQQYNSWYHATQKDRSNWLENNISLLKNVLNTSTGILHIFAFWKYDETTGTFIRPAMKKRLPVPAPVV